MKILITKCRKCNCIISGKVIDSFDEIENPNNYELELFDPDSKENKEGFNITGCKCKKMKTGIEILNSFMCTPVKALQAFLEPNDKLEDVKIIDPMDLHKIAEKIDAIIEQNKRLTKWINDLNDNKHYHLWANMNDIEQKLSKQNVERLGRV